MPSQQLPRFQCRATEGTRNYQLNLLDKGHDNCKTHAHYRLTCAQYEALLARSGGLCEICSAPGATENTKKLAIDHDPRIGQWAVRGLLCRKCNTGMDRMSPVDTRLTSFLAKAWYLDAAGALGLLDIELIEPPLNMTVGDHIGLHWRRLKRGWTFEPPNRNYYRFKRPISWSSLIYDRGPLNLHVHLKGNRAATYASTLRAN